jgi:carboxyl-terminal processing protease
MRKTPQLLTLFLIPICVSLWIAPDAAAAPIACKTITKFVDRFLENHIRDHQLTPELERRTTDVFIRSFDPSQSALLESEVKDLRTQMVGSFAKIASGDCSQLQQTHQMFIKRHDEISLQVAEFVGAEDYAIDTEVELLLDAKKRGYPKTVAERDLLLHKLVHFQMSNYISSATDMDEAKALLAKRYDRRARRLKELDAVDLFSSFLDAFASSLDPHSNYFSADVYEDFRIQMSLSLTGIGVALSEQDGFAVVERIIEGGAAAQLDVLKPKDKIIEVGQGDDKAVSIIDMPLRDAVSLIRGEKGTTVRLTVLRQADTTDRFEVPIVRQEINLEDQAASLRVEEREIDGRTVKLAILELPSFYGDSDPSKRQCTDDVARLLREVNEMEADGLVLDLSHNGGGLLTHAVTVSGFFLRKGEIVKVKTSRGHQEVLSDRDEAILYSGPLVVHTSRVSASAAEILAGALKDYKRAIIAGDDHTFGKGTVQTVSSLAPDQGALKITTAMFYRPGGRSTQHAGVEADIVIPSLLSGDDFGEKHQPFSIEGDVIESFQGSYANANPESSRWKVVSHEIVARLAEASKRRIAASSDFDEVAKELQEARDNDGVIKLADLMKKREEGKAKDDEDSSEEGGDELETADDGESQEVDEMSPQLTEATNVLFDLISLNPQKPIRTTITGVSP